LAEKFDRSKVVRINVSRATIWDGAIRAFNRPSYTAHHQHLIRFSDDDGASEGAVDQGGPLREFFRLIFIYLFGSRLFSGPLMAKNITLDVQGL